MTANVVDRPVAASAGRSTGFRAVVRRVRQDRWAVASAVLIAVFVVVAIAAPLIAAISGQDPYKYHVDALNDFGAPRGALGGVSGTHWFGVEPLTGRDLFAIVTYGARTSLGIGLAATALSIVIGVLVGVTTGFFGGWYDRVLSRIVDVIFGFPSLVFMIALTAIVPTSFPKPVLVVLVIGFFGWPAVARVVRGQTLSLVTRNYVVASTAMGAGRWHVIRTQLLPNLAATITVYATISIPSMIGAEAALSFLAVGVTPPTPSWGRSIGDAIGWVQTDPMYLVFPGAALFLVTLAFNVLGDALRDALDPVEVPGDHPALHRGPCPRCRRRPARRRRDHLRAVPAAADEPGARDLRQALHAGPAPRGAGVPRHRQAVARAVRGVPRRDLRRSDLRLRGVGHQLRRAVLRYSFQLHENVTDLILSRLPVTASIAVGAALLWLVAGVVGGAVSALRRGTFVDRAVMTVAVAGVSSPSYLIGLLAILLFGFVLGVLPTSGYVAFTDDPVGWFTHLVLPWCVLAFISAAIYARLTRGEMLESMSQDFVRTARAKGLRERQVVVRHGLRTAILPVVTLFGLDLGSLLGGAVITEKVFSMQGLGALLIDAVHTLDLQVVVGFTLFSAMLIVVANMIVDIVYAFVDPRVRRRA